MHAMEDRLYFTYILASRSHTLYMDVTNDLRRRVFQHKGREHPAKPKRAANRIK
jgi:putative endonuclease